MTELILSLFPGVGLLDLAFSQSGFCVVRGPDLIHGGDVRDFAAVPGRFDGIIGGSPCQGFSVANAFRTDDLHPSVVTSRLMISEFIRIVLEADVPWFLHENVPTVPDIRIPGYHIQRIPISDFQCGGRQDRLRHIQFGSKSGEVIRPVRVNDQARNRRIGRKPEAVTTKTSAHTTYPQQCRKQGLTEPLDLPGWTKSARFKGIGNGVPLTIGRSLASAVTRRSLPRPDDCPCGCGRVLTGRQRSAGPACRKRLQLDRERVRSFVDLDGFHAETKCAGPVTVSEV